jgi:hypothetical protein
MRAVIVVLVSMALPVALSVAGPIYYGYMNGPHSPVLIWAAVCTIGTVWFYRHRSQQRSAMLTILPPQSW